MWTREQICGRGFAMQITLRSLVCARRMPKLIENMKNYETHNQECQEWCASPSTSTVCPMPVVEFTCQNKAREYLEERIWQRFTCQIIFEFLAFNLEMFTQI